MKKFLQVGLGIVTSIGGYLDAGSLVTAAQAGAAFGFQLGWALLLGTLCLIFLVEMSGRLAAVSGHTIVDAMRERFGFAFFLIPFTAMSVVSFLVLCAEIGGICVSLKLLTGLPAQLWALPSGFLVWLVLWRATFGVIENGVSLLGLVTVVFLVVAIRLHPPLGRLASGLLPSLPGKEPAQYGYLAVSVLGATVSPYLFYFYSSGAVEERWDRGRLGQNRVVSAVGMTFGGLLAFAVLVIAAMVLEPRNIRIERFHQAALLLTSSLGTAGLYLFLSSLFITCFGAALEVALSLAYLAAQGLGWNWGASQRPRNESRFSLVYTAAILLASLLMAIGIDPLKLTVLSMALTSAVLPVAIFPFLLLLNDESYLGRHRNGWLSNTVVVVVVLLAAGLAVVSIPLQILGG
jgi:Mn2+/Fe2+ NRAMP family transporter